VSATTVIDHLAVRWHPLDASVRDQARFDRLSRALARGPLDAAIDAGAHHGDVICVRAVEVPPVRITADLTDDELLGRLAAAIAAAVGTAVSDTSDQATCVRYRSRAHAALDVAISLARGDHRREWAWRQLGLWPDRGEPPAAGERVAAALAAAPGAVTGLLSAAAGAGALGFLADLLGPGRLDAVVRAAWTAHGCPLPGWDDLLGPAAVPDDADFAQVTALLARGALGRELLGGGGLPPQSVAAASAAALLDAEPSLPLRPASRVTPLVTAAALVCLGRGRWRDDRESGMAGSRSPGEGEAWAVPSPPADDEVRTVPSPSADDEVRAVPSPPADAAGRQPATAPQPGSARPDAETTADPAAPASARGVTTQYGGLPYLLHLVGRCGLPERAADGELASAGLVRLLYEIGLRILGRLAGPVETPDPEDAALACLCGRAPQARWPSGIGTGQPGHHLSRVADAEAERLIAALRAALEPSGLAAAPEQDLLSAICRRHGRIVADPGWIDVHLEHAEVSTDVRRAGLDLDPGYLSWLGCVVRFVYG
jgi:hypothetical protein